MWESSNSLHYHKQDVKKHKITDIFFLVNSWVLCFLNYLAVVV